MLHPPLHPLASAMPPAVSASAGNSGDSDFNISSSTSSAGHLLAGGGGGKAVAAPARVRSGGGHGSARASRSCSSSPARQEQSSEESLLSSNEGSLTALKLGKGADGQLPVRAGPASNQVKGSRAPTDRPTGSGVRAGGQSPADADPVKAAAGAEEQAQKVPGQNAHGAAATCGVQAGGRMPADFATKGAAAGEPQTAASKGPTISTKGGCGADGQSPVRAAPLAGETGSKSRAQSAPKMLARPVPSTSPQSSPKGGSSVGGRMPAGAGSLAGGMGAEQAQDQDEDGPMVRAGRVQPAPPTPPSSHGTPAAGSVHIDMGGNFI